jgi:pimeloyl-ACP methyl ester carboxylesterase
MASATWSGAGLRVPAPIPRHGSFRGLSAAGFHRLHYCDWGDRDNPRVVICAHGSGRHARDFDILAHALSTHHRVVCPDLSGRGERDWLGTSMAESIPQCLADLSVLLSHLDVTRVDWVGTSLGAQLGVNLAALPGSPIRRLVLHDLICDVIPDLGGDWNDNPHPVLHLHGNAPQAMTAEEIDGVSDFLDATPLPHRFPPHTERRALRTA